MSLSIFFVPFSKDECVMQNSPLLPKVLWDWSRGLDVLWGEGQENESEDLGDTWGLLI